MDINFLPWREEAKRNRLQKIILFYIKIILPVILFWIGAHYFVHQKNIHLSNDLRQLKSHVILENKMMPIQNDFAHQELSRKQIVVFEILNGLFHLKQNNVFLNDIFQSNAGLILVGNAESILDIRNFMSSIFVIKSVHALKLLSLTNQNNHVQFKIQITEVDRL